MRKPHDYILLYLKGLSMGAADVIPGLSGGTVAFITGIYEELMLSIREIDLDALRLLTKFRLADFWEKINGNFLVTILAGLFTSIVFIATVMNFLVTHYPIQLWSFFFGVILIAAPLLLREIKHWTLATSIPFLAGIVIAYSITILSPAQTTNGLWFIFIAGALAICALILPGISGTFILLLIGKYQYIMAAVHSFNIPVIFVFFLGCVVGIISLSHCITWIFENYHSITVALFAGFMLGSLNKVWPWREVREYVTTAKGDQLPAIDKSILPWDYLTKTGKDPLIFQAILMIALGIFIIVLVEKIAARLKTKN